MANIHFSSNTSHSIDFARVWPCSVNHNRSLNFFSACQSDTSDFLAVVIDRNNFRLKPGFSTMMFGRIHIIMCCQHRVVHKATERIIKTAQLAYRIIAKGRIVNFFRRPITSRIKCRKLFAQLLCTKHFVRNANFVPNLANRFSAITFGAINEIASANKFRHAIWVVDTEIASPVLPHRCILPGH